MRLKKLSIFSIKCIYLIYLLFSSLIFSLQAMEENQEEAASKPSTPRIDIISPEGYMIVQRLNMIAYNCPQAAQLPPKIDSVEDYRVAHEYLNCSKEYGTLLHNCAISAAKSELIEESQRVFIGLLSYIEALQSPSCDTFKSEEGEKMLKMNYYEVYYRIAQNHLFLLIPPLVTLKSPRDPHVINHHVQEIKKIKKILSTSCKHRKLLQEELQKVQELVPGLISLFDPHIKQKNSRSFRKPLKRIVQQRAINQHEKVSNCIPQAFLDEAKDSFDLFFHCTVDKILTAVLSLSLKKMHSEDYIHQLQKLTEDYMRLENEGIRFRAKLLGQKTPLEQINSNIEELTDLYKFFCKRFLLPQKNPLHLLEYIIVPFIHAGNFEGALLRTEVLKNLLFAQGRLSDQFIAFRASVLALNGDHSEWKSILEKRKEAAEAEKKHAHQQVVNRLKHHLTQQEVEVAPVEARPLPKQVKRNPQPSIISNNFSDSFSFPLDNAIKSESVPRREKIKTRKPSPISISKHAIPKTTIKKEPSRSLPTTQKTYLLSKNAFKTYGKIRRGDRKFSRRDLYNLFEKLDCEVDVSQGKGDHGKIIPPLNMTIKNKEGLIAVIPEFTQIVCTNDTPFPLTIPNWDEKWDGRVPPYLIKSILNALDYLGATDETVYKNKNI